MILQDIPDDTPRVPRELLDHLDAIYPAEAWKKAKTVEELRILQGAFEVIDKLRHLHSIQIGDPDVLRT